MNQPSDAIISIIGPGMKVIGDCITDGTMRVEGEVEGSIKAGKAVVVGKEGSVDGNIETQDAVISGKVNGTINAASRLELQSTCRIDGEVYVRRMQLEEGAILNGRVHMGETKAPEIKTSKASSATDRPQERSNKKQSPQPVAAGKA